MNRLRQYSEWILFAAILLGIAASIFWPNNEFVKGFSSNSTAILAFLTAAYVILTRLLLKATREAIEEQHRPYVVASLPVEKFIVLCRIENSGDRPAYSVNVTFSPKLEALSGDAAFRGMGEPLLFQSFLPPHFTVQNTISTTVHALSVPEANKVFSVTVTYNDAKGKRYEDSYKIDVNSYLFVKKMVPKFLEDHVEEIAKQLSEIKELIKKQP